VCVCVCSNVVFGTIINMQDVTAALYVCVCVCIYIYI
jgi:hypothetical protein